MSQTELVNVGAALTVEMGGPLLGAVVPAAAELGYLLPYSRAQESEADHIGLLLMAKAAYDPRKAVALWQRMDRSTGGSGRAPEFLSTHPTRERGSPIFRLGCPRPGRTTRTTACHYQTCNSPGATIPRAPREQRRGGTPGSPAREVRFSQEAEVIPGFCAEGAKTKNERQ